MIPNVFIYTETRTKTSIRYAREKIERRERERQIINKIKIDTYLFVKRSKQIKLGCFRHKQHDKSGAKSVT